MILAALAALAAKPPPPSADAAKAAARALLSALEGSLDDCPTCAHEHRNSADPLRVAVALDAHGNAHHSKASVLRDAAAGRGGAKLYAHAAALFPDDIAPALLEHAKALLKGKADLKSGDEAGMTALHLAAQHGHLEVCQRLIQAKASPEAENTLGRRPTDFQDAEFWAAALA